MSAKSIFTSAILGAVLMATLIQFACGATVAIDDASQLPYIDGWQAGDNGGGGFGPWSFAFSGDGIGLMHPPQFIDNGPLPGNSLGAPAFALSTGDQRNAYETSQVQRIFVSPIGIGQTLSADVDGSMLDASAPAYTIGNTFDLLGTNGSERFSLFTNNQYHSDHWTVTGDADTEIPAGNSFHLDFKLVTTNSYDLVISPIGGGAPYFTQTGVYLAGTSGVAINRLRISDYGTGSSSNGSKELFFDNLMVIDPSIPGDFNKDNIVDAADYAFWRKNGLDANSYNLWRTHYGQFVSASASSAATSQFVIPEPTGATLALMSFIGYIACGFRLSSFAAEPDVQNPIAITTDDRERFAVYSETAWARHRGRSRSRRGEDVASKLRESISGDDWAKHFRRSPAHAASAR